MKTVPYPIPPDEHFVFAHNNGDGTVVLYQDGDAMPTFPDVPAPVSLTPRQFRQALTKANLRAMVEQMIGEATQDTKDWYEFATSFESRHPVVLQMAQAMGKTQADVDALFAMGEQL